MIKASAAACWGFWLLTTLSAAHASPLGADLPTVQPQFRTVDAHGKVQELLWQSASEWVWSSDFPKTPVLESSLELPPSTLLTAFEGEGVRVLQLSSRSLRIEHLPSAGSANATVAGKDLPVLLKLPDRPVFGAITRDCENAGVSADGTGVALDCRVEGGELVLGLSTVDRTEWKAPAACKSSRVNPRIQIWRCPIPVGPLELSSPQAGRLKLSLKPPQPPAVTFEAGLRTGFLAYSETVGPISKAQIDFTGRLGARATFKEDRFRAAAGGTVTLFPLLSTPSTQPWVRFFSLEAFGGYRFYKHAERPLALHATLGVFYTTMLIQNRAFGIAYVLGPLLGVDLSTRLPNRHPLGAAIRALPALDFSGVQLRGLARYGLDDPEGVTSSKAWLQAALKDWSAELELGLGLFSNPTQGNASVSVTTQLGVVRAF